MTSAADCCMPCRREVENKIREKYLNMVKRYTVIIPSQILTAWVVAVISRR